MLSVVLKSWSFLVLAKCGRKDQKPNFLMLRFVLKSWAFPVLRKPKEKKQKANNTGSKLPPTVKRSRHEESSDDLQTVIDVLTLSTKSYKKEIRISALIFAVILIIFFIADILFQITSFGDRIYSFLLPPAI